MYNNNNNNPICKAPEYQKTSMALKTRGVTMEQAQFLEFSLRMLTVTESKYIFKKSATDDRLKDKTCEDVMWQADKANLFQHMISKVNSYNEQIKTGIYELIKTKMVIKPVKSARL